ncbi:MAG TPA: hypothetical protein VHD62_01160 [Opitutaceae bacterium]|nr:hypothetical protein [Opitutaceae bacterium]
MSVPSSPDSPPPGLVLGEVKYSLPQLLRELKVERSADGFAMEKLDQHEIGKLFKTKAPRRAKSKR